MVVLVGASCFTLNLIQMLVMLPPVRVAAASGRLGHGLGLALHNRLFLVYTLLMMGFWFMWVQLSISLPLVAVSLTGTSDSVGLIYAVNAFMAIVLQYPLLRFLAPRVRPFALLTLGVGLMSGGLGGVALAHSLPALVFCVIVFSLGALLVQPTQQTVTASLADPAALGSYFGLGSLALAIGGGLGNFSGGLLYGWGQQYATPALPWLVFCAIGASAAVGLALLDRSRQRVAARSLATAPTAQHSTAHSSKF